MLQQEKIEQLETEIIFLERQLQESENQIKSEKTNVNPYSQASVNQFNPLLPPHKKLTAKYNDKISLYNNLIQQQKTYVNSFNDKCTIHPYYIDDMIYVLKKLGLYG